MHNGTATIATKFTFAGDCPVAFLTFHFAVLTFTLGFQAVSTHKALSGFPAPIPAPSL
jgi:hypothetical protein